MHKANREGGQVLPHGAESLTTLHALQQLFFSHCSAPLG